MGLKKLNDNKNDIFSCVCSLYFVKSINNLSVCMFSLATLSKDFDVIIVKFAETLSVIQIFNDSVFDPLKTVFVCHFDILHNF